MTKYVKLTLTPARAAVAIVFVALFVGDAAKSGAEPAKVMVTRAAAVTQPQTQVAQVLKGTNALKLKGLNPELKRDLTAIGNDFNFVSRVMEREGIFYYFKHGSGNHHLLTSADASKEFLTRTDASKAYLPIGGTAQNSSKVGGLAPSAFVQGDGRLVSGGATLSGGTKSQKLLSSTGIEVDVAINNDGFPSVTINDSTGVVIPAVLDQGGTDGAMTLQPGSNSLTLSLPNGVDQLHLQTFPTGAFNRVVTLTVSIDFNPAQGSSAFTGQLLDGGT